MNITNIDDKIIKRAMEQNVDFEQFAQKFENEFFEDMRKINVEPPEILTRVTEFIPEIVEFISKLIENNYAYASNGSVYFDVKKFVESQKFIYGILEPTSVNNEELLKEGEGELTQASEGEKRNAQDFALWKKSKENEPQWPSPWSSGRPGWHIECSVMAAHAFPHPIDIHSGGIDLKFPHHTNELAQSEAYYQKPQWINYFIHTGHLNIDGQKMSKSKKNFFKISEILEKLSGNELRLLFLLHQYDGIMDYSATSFQEAVDKFKKYNEFFLNLKVKMRQYKMALAQKWDSEEFKLHELLLKTKQDIYDHFAKNFATKSVLGDLDLLMKSVYNYINNSQAPKFTILNEITTYIKFIFSCMGINFNIEISEEELLITPLMNVLNQYRNAVKLGVKLNDKSMLEKGFQTAKSQVSELGIIVIEKENEPLKIQYIEEKENKKISDYHQQLNSLTIIFLNFLNSIQKNLNEPNLKSLLKFCDELRDAILPYQGIRIEDKKLEDPSIWKFESKEKLIKELEAKKEQEEEKKANSNKNQKQQKQKTDQISKEEKMKINPKEMFLKQTDLYSKFDENGIPTHNSEGSELEEKAKNRLKQEWHSQKKLYEKFLSKQK
eukprot:TRINITY_DN267_c0_g1_i6.p1 TRINITY_DN267_c0_g1~~TRINITY_DN267_c0_g1_i6.p1  ORF type:complete len:609 (-),score=125.04 TRINITY_DN267_c0_g1_i6:43-1869(-)